jgi:hypothetical protein
MVNTSVNFRESSANSNIRSVKFFNLPGYSQKEEEEIILSNRKKYRKDKETSPIGILRQPI